MFRLLYWMIVYGIAQSSHSLSNVTMIINSDSNENHTESVNENTTQIIQQSTFNASQIPTNSPTNSASNSPSKSPTKSPTKPPTKVPTLNPSQAPTRSPIEEIEWKLSYGTKSQIDASNTAITHYSVTFESFECIDIKCECKNIDIKTNIAFIQRESNDLSCKDIFVDHFRFSILPGIVYKFEILPGIINDHKMITQSKIFSITQKINPKILSFALSLKLDSGSYNSLNMDRNQLSKKLTNEAARIGEIKPHHISVEIDVPKKTNIATIKIIIAKINYSTESQIAIEKIRNLYYVPDKSFISNIIQQSDSMQIAAISLKDSPNASDSDTTYLGYNYGALIFVIIIITVLAWLMSKYFPTKFSIIVNVCKLIIVSFIQCIQPLMERLTRYISDIISKYISNSTFSRNIQSAYAPQYDVLNISEDIEMGEQDLDDESAIVLLNEVFDEEDIAPFTRERYIKVLKDNWLTKIEQLQQLNTQDWVRFGIPQNIQDAITSKLKDEKTQDSQFIIGEETNDNNDEANDNDLSSTVDHELSYPPSDNNAATVSTDIQTATAEHKPNELTMSDSFSDF